MADYWPKYPMTSQNSRLLGPITIDHFGVVNPKILIKLFSITIQPVVCGIINVVFGLLCLLLKDVEILGILNQNILPDSHNTRPVLKKFPGKLSPIEMCEKIELEIKSPFEKNPVWIDLD